MLVATNIQMIGGVLDLQPELERFVKCRFVGVMFTVVGPIKEPVFVQCTFDETGNARTLDPAVFDECLIGRTAINFRVG